MDTERQFIDILFNSLKNLAESSNRQDVNNLKEITQYFGSSIKTFNINTRGIDEGDFIDVLEPMKSLEKLMVSFVARNATVKTVHLNHLQSLILKSNWTLAPLFCPNLQTLEITYYDDLDRLTSFLRRNTQLKQLVFDLPKIRTTRSILDIDGLSLKSLKISRFLASSLSTAKITAFNSALCKQKALREVEIPMNFSLFNGQVSSTISKLLMLETLSISLDTNGLSGEQIEDIIQMRNLKTIIFKISKLSQLRPLATVGDLRLEKISLSFEGFNSYSQVQQVESLQAIAKNLPKMKMAELSMFDITAALNFALKSNHLEHLEITASKPISTGVKFDANPNIRELHVNLYYLRGFNDMKAYVTSMPKISCLQIRNIFSNDKRVKDDSESLICILSLSHLTEFGTDSRFLQHSKVFSTIMKHGKKLKKIKAFLNAYSGTFSAHSKYARHFVVEVIPQG